MQSVASAPPNRMVITLTTSPCSLHLSHSLPGALASSATRLILDVWLFTENQRPGWLSWLQGQSCPSTHWCYLPAPRWDGTTTLKANLEMFEVRLHSPIVRPLSRVIHASRLTGTPVTWFWDCLPLCPLWNLLSRGWRMSPSRSWVFLQPLLCLPPVSSFIWSVGNMTHCPSVRLSAHRPVTECVLPPWKKYFNKICSWYIKPSSRYHTVVWCSSEHSLPVVTVLSLNVFFHTCLHREIWLPKTGPRKMDE